LIRSMPSVLEKFQCHLLVAGTGPLEREIRDELTKLNISKNVTLLGYLGREYLDVAYAISSIFVLPTYHHEGFPVAVQEALWHGLPIVTSPIRGVLDHLTDRVNVLFTPPKDPNRLAENILTLLTDAELMRQMAAANRAKARDFESDVVVTQYLRIMKDAIKGPVERHDQACRASEPRG